MIASVRAEGTISVSGGGGGQVIVPDIKIPEGVEWNVYKIPGVEAFHFYFDYQGTAVWSSWFGPHTISTQTVYIVDIPDGTDRAILTLLQNRLGGSANALPLHRALQERPAVRTWVKAQPWFRPIRNSSGNIVGMYSPLVICGRSPIDLDGDEIETAAEHLDME